MAKMFSEAVIMIMKHTTQSTRPTAQTEAPPVSFDQQKETALDGQRANIAAAIRRDPDYKEADLTAVINAVYESVNPEHRSEKNRKKIANRVRIAFLFNVSPRRLVPNIYLLAF